MESNWIACSNGSIPLLAVLAGVDSDGDAIYIGRALYNDDLLPAKIIPNKSKAYISYGHSEISVDSYEALSGGHYEWISSSDGGVPEAAVKCGRNVDGELLYAGRGNWEGSLTVGKVHPSHGCLYIPYDGQEVKLTEYEILVESIKWIDATAETMPEDAVEGGHDSDGDAIYVGRVYYNSEILPAKVIPNKGGAYVSWQKQEIKTENFQVLCGSQFAWSLCDNGNVAPQAIAAGKTSDGETLYVGRSNYEGSLSIGKVHPSHGCLYIPFDGQEVNLRTYEMLIFR